MPSPFPGMDPWLEHPALWSDVHAGLITRIQEALLPSVRPRYTVGIGERAYVEAPQEGQLIPDAVVVERPDRRRSPAVAGAQVADQPTIVLVAGLQVREPFLEIRELHGDRRVVTVIEILSPSNKRPGAGREEYLRKQAQVLSSDASLVEVDLLRGGRHTVALPEEWTGASQYRVVVSRATDRVRREVYGRTLDQPLPRVGIPLTAPDPDVVLDLQAVFSARYDAAGYADRVDYDRDPLPPLTALEAARARERIAAWRESPGSPARQ